MKYLLTFIISAITFSSAHLYAQETRMQTDSIKVYGECGMCQDRIEKAVKVKGVNAATWNEESKILVITYDAAIISNEEIQKKVAAVGHDTEKFKAEDKVYKKLPGCCQYDRKP